MTPDPSDPSPLTAAEEANLRAFFDPNCDDSMTLRLLNALTAARAELDEARELCERLQADLKITRHSLSVEQRRPTPNEIAGNVIAEQRKRAEAAESLASRAQGELEGLTPGGSEYAGDPKACAAYVREVRTSQHAQIVRFKAERNRAQGEAAMLRAALAGCMVAMVKWGGEEDGMPEGSGIGAWEAYLVGNRALSATPLAEAAGRVIAAARELVTLTNEMRPPGTPEGNIDRETLPKLQRELKASVAAFEAAQGTEGKDG